jgi:hypothetical protein
VVDAARRSPPFSSMIWKKQSYRKTIIGVIARRGFARRNL